jgi:hypothetical protein
MEVLGIRKMKRPVISTAESGRKQDAAFYIGAV